MGEGSVDVSRPQRQTAEPVVSIMKIDHSPILLCGIQQTDQR